MLVVPLGIISTISNAIRRERIKWKERQKRHYSWWKGLFISLIVFSTITPISNQVTCPIGSISQKSCQTQEDCKDGEGCFKRDENSAGSCCNIPYSFATYTFSKDVPINYSPIGGIVLQKCLNNKECWEGNYCGRPYNPSFPNNYDRSGTKYCYPKPPILQNLELTLFDNDDGLSTCDKQEDCYDGICFILGNGKNVSINSISNVPGICVKVPSCPTPYPRSDPTGRLLTGKKFCSVDADCADKSNDTTESSCIQVLPKYPNMTLCCNGPKKCAYGAEEFPKKTCKTSGDCEERSWCDEKLGTCCKGVSKTESTCPDGAVPWYNEPKCKDVNRSSPNSGTCEHNPGALCYNGHCCPTTKLVNGNVELGNVTYITTIPCDIIPNVRFQYAFCHDGKTGIAGMDIIEMEFNSANYVTCTTNRDCSVFGLGICVRRNDDLFCVDNPLYGIGDILRENWYYLVIILLVIILIISLAVYFVLRKIRKCRIDQIGTQVPVSYKKGKV